MSRLFPSGVERTTERAQIVDSVVSICNQFDDRYWSQKDQLKEFPYEFREAMASAGWLGMTMPTEYGGSGLGVTEAALMMRMVGHSAGSVCRLFFNSH